MTIFESKQYYVWNGLHSDRNSCHYEKKKKLIRNLKPQFGFGLTQELIHDLINFSIINLENLQYH